MDTDYITKTGDHLHITGTDIGLDFETEGQAFSLEYGELADHIDSLILHGVYPYSAEDSVLDDYAIPDELDEMKGIEEAEQDDDNEESPKPVLQSKEKIIHEILSGNVTFAGGKQRIYHAMLELPAKKDRVQVLKREFGTGGERGSRSDGSHYPHLSGSARHFDLLP